MWFLQLFFLGRTFSYLEVLLILVVGCNKLLLQFRTVDASSVINFNRKRLIKNMALPTSCKKIARSYPNINNKKKRNPII